MNKIPSGVNRICSILLFLLHSFLRIGLKYSTIPISIRWYERAQSGDKNTESGHSALEWQILEQQFKVSEFAACVFRGKE